LRRTPLGREFGNQTVHEGFDDDTNTLLASPVCEADLGVSDIGWYGEFSFGDRSGVPVC
jgi:hypothetical protein